MITFYILWAIMFVVQVYFGYGTVYRLTKAGSRDNGVSAFGWMVVITIASAIPGLGLFLWYKYRDLGNEYAPTTLRRPAYLSNLPNKCRKCHKEYSVGLWVCPHCT